MTMACLLSVSHEFGTQLSMRAGEGLRGGLAVKGISRHCEERSDEAIQSHTKKDWIASLRSQ
jgi:hypothetical protein